MPFVKCNCWIFIHFILISFFSEALKAQKPSWLPPNPALYSFNTSVTAVIKFDGVISSSLEDTIAFVVGSQIRGISIPTKVGNEIRHYASVYSSLTSEPIGIKIYHALSNKVYEVKDSMPFIAQSPIGDYDNPYEVIVFSSGDAPISIDSIDEKFTLKNIPFDTIDLKSFLNQPETDPVAWSVLPNADFLTNITGSKLHITPRNGFIGSGLIEIKAVEQTQNANFASQSIKLNVLQLPVRPGWDSIPGQGITKGNEFKVFSLPAFENKYSGNCLTFEYLPILPEIIQPDSVPSWIVQQNFLNSMTFIAKPVYTPLMPFNHPDDRLAAFIDGEIRGVAEPQIINGQILYFLGVGSQQSVGVISFHFYSGALKKKFISHLKISYVASEVRGSVEIPYQINLSPIQPILDSNNLVQLQIVDTSWVGEIDFRFLAKDCSIPNLSAASQALLESFTFVKFCVTSNISDLFTYYKDEDGDGFGDAANSQTICESVAPPNYVSNNLDCDDRDDAIKTNPTVASVQNLTFCNGILSDTITFKRGVNGVNSVSSSTIYRWKNSNTSIGLGASGSGAIAPFLTVNAKNVADSAQIIVTPEINGCIGVSDTFILFVKTEKLITYYKDEDGDGFGNAADSIKICEANIPPNYVSNKLDCDDKDDAIKPYPTVAKNQDYTFCNGILSDTIALKRGINGLNSLSSKTIFKWTNNNSSIGLGASGSGTINPFLITNTRIFNDSARIVVTPELNGCIGVSDTFILFVKTEKLITYYKDEDGDGFGNPAFSQTICEANIPPNYVTNKLDCDDTDDAIRPYPTVSKIQDFVFCNGILSDSISLKRGTNGVNSMTSKTIYKWTNNNSSIGLGASGSGTIAPFLTMNSKNVADSARIIITPELNGCIGVSDTFFLFVKAEKLITYYKDEDGDGFGNSADSIKICEANVPPNYVTNKLDCDDMDDAIKPYPTVSKIQDFTLCNGILSDTITLKRGVNGLNSLSSKTIFKWTNNNSSIGLGASGSGTIVPFLTTNTKNVINSAQIIVTPELNGCIGVNDTFLLFIKAEKLVTYYKDLDGDGFGNATDSLKICEANVPPNYVTNKLDCDDKDDEIKPYPTVAKIQDFTFCNGILSDTITLKKGTNGLNSLSSNIIFKWTNNNSSIGLGASGTGTIVPFLITNTRIFNDSARIIVTPEINGCVGLSDTFLLFVKTEKLITYYKDEDGDGFGNPSFSQTVCEANIPPNYVSNKLDCDDKDDAIKPYPTVAKIQNFTFCNGILSDTITLKSGTNGLNSLSSKTIYKWTNNNSSIGLGASGSGTINPFLTTNTKNIINSAQIIVTPEINGCIGVSDTFLLIVKPDTIPRVGSLNCSAYTSSSLVLPNANDLYQNTLRMPYIGGNGLKFDSMAIKSEGVSGLTMKLKEGTLIKGDGFLEFNIIGIPLQEGIAKFTIDFGRAGCDLRKPCEVTFKVGIEKSKVDSILCSKSFYLPNKIYSKVPYRGKLDLPYLGGNQKYEPSQVFKSEGIRGLNARFNSDTLKRNGGTLSFNLDGLPEQLGTSSILINIGGKSCEINLLVENLPVTLPKFFSPNGDGKNERWEIPYFNTLYPQGTVIILDRNGRKLLEYNGNFEGWDGNINGYSASTGVYWYVVQLDKGSIPLRGNFTLIR